MAMPTPKEAQNIVDWIRNVGWAGTTFIIVVLFAVQLFRTDDRYRGKDAARDQELLKTWVQVYVDREITERVPSPAVVSRLASIEATLTGIQRQLDTVEKDVRQIRNGKTGGG